jgi:hypothetical protein
VPWGLSYPLGAPAPPETRPSIIMRSSS